MHARHLIDVESITSVIWVRTHTSNYIMYVQCVTVTSTDSDPSSPSEPRILIRVCRRPDIKGWTGETRSGNVPGSQNLVVRLKYYINNGLFVLFSV